MKNVWPCTTTRKIWFGMISVCVLGAVIAACQRQAAHQKTEAVPTVTPTPTVFHQQVLNAQIQSSTQTILADIEGVVFEDRNGNGQQDAE